MWPFRPRQPQRRDLTVWKSLVDITRRDSPYFASLRPSRRELRETYRLGQFHPDDVEEMVDYWYRPIEPMKARRK